MPPSIGSTMRWRKLTARVPFLVSRREGKALEKALKGYKTGNALIRDIIADEDDAPKEIGKASAAKKPTRQSIASRPSSRRSWVPIIWLSCRGFLLKMGREVAESAQGKAALVGAKRFREGMGRTGPVGERHEGQHFVRHGPHGDPAQARRQAEHIGQARAGGQAGANNQAGR